MTTKEVFGKKNLSHPTENCGLNGNLESLGGWKTISMAGRPGFVTLKAISFAPIMIVDKWERVQ